MIINANALRIPLADQSVHMIVTSPPYWGLRNYGVSGQLGLERTPEEYIANMVAVFRECWRVLRDDGTCWVNIGDSYSGNGKTNSSGGPSQKQSSNKGSWFLPRDIETNVKPKDLVGIPWRLAFALQADGWYLRSDIIWSKPNPMPESVTDRPTKSHEYLFLLAKQERYYYDQEAIREDFADERMGNPSGGGQYMRDLYPDNPHAQSGLKKGVWTNGELLGGRNRRSVWTIPTAPYKGAHFATFPPALVEPCIKAGTSERGCCPKCGKGWKRIIKAEGGVIGRSWSDHKDDLILGNHAENAAKGENGYKKISLGWQPDCTCSAGEPIPCLVFDPFVGSGTTVKVAYDLGRRGVGLDLSLDYLDEQARKRIHNGHTARLF